MRRLAKSADARGWSRVIRNAAPVRIFHDVEEMLLDVREAEAFSFYGKWMRFQFLKPMTYHQIFRDFLSCNMCDLDSMIIHTQIYSDVKIPRFHLGGHKPRNLHITINLCMDDNRGALADPRNIPFPPQKKNRALLVFHQVPTTMNDGPCLLVLHGLRFAHNVGAALRCSQLLGAQGTLLLGGVGEEARAEQTTGTLSP